MRWFVGVCIFVALVSCEEELYFIPGTGTLPDCDETPVTDLSGQPWFDQGTVTIRSDGCPDAMVGDEFQSCALNWYMSQDGNEVSIVVDDEYRLEGRICGDKLHLRGGWWLPVMDEDGFCYEDDSAEEVGIQAEGNVLTYMPPDAQQPLEQMQGTLVVQGRCAADYDVVFQRVRDPSLT